MTLSHKAFAVDWRIFENALAGRLAAALAANDPAPLLAFVQANLAACKDPYDGQSLPSAWADSLEVGDVQEAADYALTLCYQPAHDFGLGESWQATASSLPEPARAALLGKPFGPPHAPFDPGRQGSYFQTPESVQQSIAALAHQSHPALRAFRAGLAAVAEHGNGLYVTF